MKKFIEYFNRLVTNIFSYIYRIIILISGFSIVYTSENCFPIYVYWILAVVYCGFFILLKFRYPKHDILRNLNDMIFVLLFSFNRNVDTAVQTLFICLPVLNYGNHTNKKPSKRGLSTYLFSWLILFFFLLKKFNLPLVILVISYLFIILVYEIRRFFERISSAIEEQTIDSYENLNSERNQQPHILLRKIMNELNNYLPNNILDIFCFQITKEKMYIKYSTHFVINYSVIYDQQEIDQNTNLGFFEGITIEADKEKYENTISYHIFRRDKSLLYIINFASPPNSITKLLVDTYIRKSLIYLNKIIISDIEFGEKTQELQEMYNSRVSFINATHNVVHYIKNNLSPIRSYIEMVQILMQENTLPDSIELSYLKEQKDCVYRTIDSILDHSKSVVDECKEFIENLNFEIVNYQRIISVIRSNWQKYFCEDPSIQINGILDDKYKRMQFEMQSVYLDALVDNLISNMHKHQEGGLKVSIEFKDSGMLVIFKNKAKKNHIRKMQETENTFNNYTRKEEILKSRNNGLFQILVLAGQLSIIPKLRVNERDQIISFELDIKSTKDRSYE